MLAPQLIQLHTGSRPCGLVHKLVDEILWESAHIIIRKREEGSLDEEEGM